MSPKETLLYRLTELMFEKQQTFLLLDAIYEDDIISHFVRNIQIDSPYQQLLFDGVLSQYNHQNEIVVSFTIEAYFHHLLAKVLQKDERYQTAESLLLVLKERNLKGLPESISILFSFDFEKVDFNRFNEFIRLIFIFQNKLEDFNFLEYPFVYSLQINGIDKSIKKIIEIDNEWNWGLFIRVFKYLEKINEKLQYEFTKELLKYNNLSNFSQQIFALLSIQILDYHDSERYNQLIKSNLINIDENILSDFYYLLGKTEKRNANYQKSIYYFKKSNELNLKLFGELHQSVASCYSQLSTVSITIGEYENAIEYSNFSYNINLIISGPNSTSIAYHFARVGECLEKKIQLEESIIFYEKSIEIFSRTVGSFSSEMPNIFNNIGRVYQDKGENELALEYFNKSLNIDLNIFGDNSEEVGCAYNNIGGVLDSKNDFDNALIFYEKALAIFIKVYNPNHPSIGFAYNNIGSIYYEKEIFTKAIFYFRKSAKIRLRSLGFNHPDLANTYEFLGSSYKQIAEYNLGIKFFQKAFQIKPNAQILSDIADLYELINNQQKALELYLMIINMIFNRTENISKIPNRYLVNSIRLSKQLNKENELPQWIKNIN